MEIGYSETEINQKINSTFQQLFYGDEQLERVYYECGMNENGQLAYIYDANNNDVRSEGMSYGMMIAVQLNRKDVFNALWNWSKTYMYHSDSKHPAYGYFGWSLDTKGNFNDEMPAPDGEEYYTTALYFASARWGNGEGIYNYKQQADELLRNMRHRKPIKNNIRGKIVTGLNLFDEKNYMIRFTSDSTNSDHTDASYHLPAFYEVWAINSFSDDKIFWSKAAKASRKYFNKASHPLTGLTPDYGNFDGSPWTADWRANSSTYSYDAWRTAMNWSFDWSWWKKDKDAVKRSNTILKFFYKEGIMSYGNQYTLSGQKLENGQPIGIISCNAVAALASNIPIRYEFVKALWNCKVPTGKYRYYDSMLMMMALLHCSGNFKVYL